MFVEGQHKGIAKYKISGSVVKSAWVGGMVQLFKNLLDRRAVFYYNESNRGIEV